MLQIDHIYEFFNLTFKNIDIHYFYRGIIEDSNYHIFNGTQSNLKILFYDQEPLVPSIANLYFKSFKIISAGTVDPKIILPAIKLGQEFSYSSQTGAVVTSEKSILVNQLCNEFGINQMYYFYHGFAALDWYRGHYALNYNKSIVRQYEYDFITFNRIINNDRSYRIYFVSLLKEQGLLSHGQVSFNVTDNLFDDWQDEVADPNSKLSANAKQHIEHHLTDISKLVIDQPELPGSASADIPRDVDAFWNVVTETVFYYDKLHLTEKIFKPIVSKQPFMLLAAPGNLAYLKSYGFKTFDSVIDESYDLIQDNDLRTEAVVRQLHWYCNLTPGEKTDIIQQLEPIIDYNFHHFYGEFRHIITRELLDNTKTLFKEIGYDDGHINYANIHHVLTH
jgi:hypothetical protein